MRPKVFLSCVGFLAASCAGAPHGGPGDHIGPPPGGPPGPGARAQVLFIAPMGQPFRTRDAATTPMSLWFADADADHDGQISHDEFFQEAGVFFTIVDRNQDSTLTSLEATSLWQATAPEVLGPLGGGPVEAEGPRRRRRDEDDQPHDANRPDYFGSSGDRRAPRQDTGPHLTGAQPFGLLPIAEPIMSCDVDLNQRVTTAEFGACADRRFRQLDANGDGKISVEEAEAARAALRHGQRR